MYNDQVFMDYKRQFIQGTVDKKLIQERMDNLVRTIETNCLILEKWPNEGGLTPDTLRYRLMCAHSIWDDENAALQSMIKEYKNRIHNIKENFEDRFGKDNQNDTA